MLYRQNDKIGWTHLVPKVSKVICRSQTSWSRPHNQHTTLPFLAALRGEGAGSMCHEATVYIALFGEEMEDVGDVLCTPDTNEPSQADSTQTLLCCQIFLYGQKIMQCI